MERHDKGPKVAGRLARKQGVPFADNPYKDKTYRAAWEAGWREADEATTSQPANGPRDMFAKPKQKRGFAAMDPAKQRAIAAKGGASIPPGKRSFSRDPGLASSAGRKGGTISRGGGRPSAS